MTLANQPLDGSGRPFSLKATGRVARRQALSRISFWFLLAATMVGLFVLAFLLYDILANGGARLLRDFPDFLTSHASRRTAQTGIRAAVLGTVWIIGLTVVFTIPLGVGTAIWIEEFAPRTRALTIVRLNISNLAGVPSIIYGILGLAVFVRMMDLGSVILAGALTLSLMVLPIVIISSAEAIRQVPSSIRDGSLALGATRWETTWYHVLPGAIPGIMTGTILAVSRAIGETAALIMIGAFAFIGVDPESIFDRFTVLPIQVYAWTIQPGDDFKAEASAAIIVLMVLVLSLNLIAVLIRNRFRRD
jgi:phosphate transport system permease protein